MCGRGKRGARLRALFFLPERKEVRVLYILCWIAGFLVGIATPIIWRRVLASGTVEMDRTDPEIPYLRLQLTNDQLDKLHKKKYATFKVNPNAKFTREKQPL